MKKQHTIYFIILLLFVILLQLSACKKDWLDKKPIDSQVVPTSIADALALLDDNSTFNSIFPMSEMGSDDYFLTYAAWNSLPVIYYKNVYTWQSNIWEGADQQDWTGLYKRTFVANVALETLEKIVPNSTNQQSLNIAKGTGFFARALATFDLVNLYAKPYSAATAPTTPGIPLRLTANINEISSRGTLEGTFNQIINDAKRSIPLLPLVPQYRTRGSKPAAYALLARTYLNMGNYIQSAIYADSCLQLFNNLIDFNTLSITSSTPITRDNIETIYYSGASNLHNLRINTLLVDPALYASYSSNDLRKAIYFAPSGTNYTRKSSYTGDVNPFTGIATDEVYLIRAECYARTGRYLLGMNDLNALLAKRFRTGTFVALTASNANEALALILSERRKELVYRNIRWMDLRRLNQDGNFAKTLTRDLNGTVYTLSPNDRRYTFAIPDIEIFKYGMEQNER